MAQLAFEGHETRGREIIKVLKMLGGKERTSGMFNGDAEFSWYYIDEEGYINFKKSIEFHCETNVFTLEEFLKKYPFKVGDFVHIPEYESEVRICKMKWSSLCNYVEYKVYRNDDPEWYSAEELLDYNDDFLVDKEETMEEKTVNHVYNTDVISFDIAQNDIYELDLKDKFHVILREGKYYVERIKPKYPKTYKECCGILGITFDYPDISEVSTGEFHLFSKFIQLIRCRDAYWKIAGEQMGLDKFWEPNLEENDGGYRYCIRNRSNKIVLSNEYLGGNYILSFPTKEMQDTFYENFKDLIEGCKEFL